MIRTQVNQDGTTTTWNDEGKEMIVTTAKAKVSAARLAEVNEIRRFYRMSNADQLNHTLKRFTKTLE